MQAPVFFLLWLIFLILVCACVVRKPPKTDFLATRPSLLQTKAQKVMKYEFIKNNKFPLSLLTLYLIDTYFDDFANRADPDQAALIRAA